VRVAADPATTTDLTLSRHAPEHLGSSHDPPAGFPREDDTPRASMQSDTAVAVRLERGHGLSAPERAPVLLAYRIAATAWWRRM